MYYIIEENKENRITKNDKEVYISIDDIVLLNDIEKTIKHIISTSKYLKIFRLNKEIVNLINEAIIFDYDTEVVIDLLSERNFPIFSLITSYIDNEKKKYKVLKNMSHGNIVIKCNKDNFVKCLNYANGITNKVIILEAKNISLSEYKELLSKCNLEEITNSNITISYQDTTSDLSVKELYELSLLVDEIVKKINKYNLSPLEKIVYVYDFVKKREYHECENKRNSRDLDKVVKGEDIVCVGYSNLFNAILNSLDIKSRPLISLKAKHQRSLVYVKDEKYNIDGIYAFDPTWDSKKSDTYIDNYDYFAMPFEESEKDCPTQLYKNTNLKLEELIKNYQMDTELDGPVSFENINAIEELFKFTNTDGFDCISNTIGFYRCCANVEKEKAHYLYNVFLKKYNPGNIPVQILFEAIINTRIVEYYLDEQKDINIDNIKLSMSDRYSFRKTYSSNDRFDKFLRTIFCGCDILEELSEYEDKNSEKIKRKTLNIELLKTLNNKK